MRKPGDPPVLAIAVISWRVRGEEVGGRGRRKGGRKGRRGVREGWREKGKRGVGKRKEGVKEEEKLNRFSVGRLCTIRFIPSTSL